LTGGSYIAPIIPFAVLVSSYLSAPPLLCHEIVDYTDAPAIDVVKTRIQIDPALARDSLLSAGRKIVASEGPKGLLTGFGPTAVGYFFQGGAKFAGYEASVSCPIEEG
jgi:solute carrier family 25 phosphate transporter 3